MAESDYNTIKRVESLQNITGLTPAKRREERRRRRGSYNEKKQESEQEPNESAKENGLSGKLTEDEGEQHTIDYCA
ncbi:MAG: hypothetical protein ACYTEQ_00360 [Planctomycetota bacterium]|jgi:hypothetical protein